MKIDVFFTPIEAQEHYLKDKIVVAIDVLRASSSIVTALQNEAKEVIPVAEVEDALKISANLAEGQSLLCGEREGNIIKGFDLGNSPDSFTPEVIAGKSLIFCTTNGTKSFIAAKNSRVKELLVGGFVNITAVKEYILKPENHEHHLAILCAGRNNLFSLEDAVCAGLLIDKLLTDKTSGVKFELSDTATAAKILYEEYRGNEISALEISEHGKYLSSIGFQKDIEQCAKIDSSQALPILHDSVLKLLKVETKTFKRVS
jgi:2-phosphosulfolactate phosphatase